MTKHSNNPEPPWMLHIDATNQPHWWSVYGSCSTSCCRTYSCPTSHSFWRGNPLIIWMCKVHTSHNICQWVTGIHGKVIVIGTWFGWVRKIGIPVPIPSSAGIFCWQLCAHKWGTCRRRALLFLICGCYGIPTEHLGHHWVGCNK